MILGQREQKVVSEDQIRRLGELTIESKAKPMVLRELTGSRYYRQVGGRGDGEMLLVSPVRLAGPKRVLRRNIPRTREPPPELLEFDKVGDGEQLDPAGPVQKHQLCLASAGFVNLLPGRSYCRTLPSFMLPWAYEVSTPSTLRLPRGFDSNTLTHRSRPPSSGSPPRY